MLYLVCWVSLRTGDEGGGCIPLDLATAQAIRDAANARQAETWHYVVPAEGCCR